MSAGALSSGVFDEWLAAYSRAAAEDDPDASAALFADDARYFESPFDEPLIGHEAIYRYWAAGARDLTDRQATHEILAVRDNVGIARWRSRFVVRATGEAVTLDCVFLVEFDEAGRCRLFREWWHQCRRLQKTQMGTHSASHDTRSLAI